MTASRRLLPTLLLISTFVLAATGAPGARSGPDLSRITASANVTLRQAPSAGAPAVALLRLGTEVTEVGPTGMDKTWVHVKLADNREGWLIASLTRPIAPSRRWPTIEQIILERLQRHGDGFSAIVELTDFIERVPELPEPDARARLDLYRLRAVSAAIGAIPVNQGRRDAFMFWLDRQKTLVVYDEPGGRWILANKAIWEVHDRHAGTPTSDEIAWLAATNGLAGECEGDVTCYLSWRNRLEGEYLRTHPLGRHAADAVAAIRETVERLSAPTLTPASYPFDRARGCAALTTSIEALRTAVAATPAAGKDAALQGLATLRGWCK
jgi:hypothetical protein